MRRPWPPLCERAVLATGAYHSGASGRRTPILIDTIRHVKNELGKTLAAVLVMLVLAACSGEETKVVPAEPVASPPKSVVEEIASPAPVGAAEPFLLAARDGMLLSWLEPAGAEKRFALRFARYADGKWSPPRTITERDDLFVNWADFPSIAEDTNGVLYAHWLQKSGTGTYAYDVRMATSKDGGATWSASFLLNRDGKQAEHGFASLAALPNGGVGATWLDGRNMTGGGHDGHESGGDMTIRYATVDADGKIANDVMLDERTCECCTTGMAISDGGPVIAYRDRTADEIRDISYVTRRATGWTKPRDIQTDGWKINGCPVNGPQVDAIGNRVVTAWFTAAQEKQRAFVAFSDDGGTTFGKGLAVDDGKPAGRVDVVMLDPDAALVTWLEQTAAGAEIRARKVTRSGENAASIKIADSATARAAGFTRIARTRDAVWFAWTEHSKDSKKIHVARGRF